MSRPLFLAEMSMNNHQAIVGISGVDNIRDSYAVLLRAHHVHVMAWLLCKHMSPARLERNQGGTLLIKCGKVLILAGSKADSFS